MYFILVGGGKAAAAKASTMATTMGGLVLDEVEPWLVAIGLEAWCDSFKTIGLDTIDDLGAPLRLRRSAAPL